jgi:hypothetical protein
MEVRRFVVRAVAPQGLSEQARVILAQRVTEAIGFDAAIEIVMVEDIPRTQRGKRRLVISRVPFTMLDAPKPVMSPSPAGN